MKTHLASACYTLLQLLLLPGIIVLLIIVHLQRRKQDNWRERLGFLSPSPHGKKVFWFHAVSAGEVLALQEIIATIKREQPASWCYLTIGTPIGHRMATTQLSADSVSYLPYDFLPCMLLAYNRIKPDAVIVVESEMWPHLFFVAAWRKIPLFLLNARMSQRSTNRMRLLAPLVRLLFSCCSSILAQSDEDRSSFINTIGIVAPKVITLGNIKAFNVFQKRLALPVEKMRLDAIVLLAGSIHPTEETIHLGLFEKLKPLQPMLKLILVPRHFHWQHALIAHAQATGYKTAVWTNEMDSTSITSLLATHDIIIVCRFGELFTLYQYATLYFLGGTFVPVGGHNLLEPAAWGIPSLVGPYHANCLSTLRALENHHAAQAVKNSSELFTATKTFLEDPAQRLAMQQANFSWIKKEAHRVENTMRSTLFKSLFI